MKYAIAAAALLGLCANAEAATATRSGFGQLADGGGTVAGTVSIANGRVAYGEGMSWATAKPGSTLTVLAIK